MLTNGCASCRRHYYSWVVSSLLNQQNMQMHTYPRALFRLLNFTAAGPSCLPSKVPADRALTSSEASALHHDSEELLRNIYVAPYTKPMASFVDDLPMRQRHLGWQVGYYAGEEKQVAALLRCCTCMQGWKGSLLNSRV